MQYFEVDSKSSHCSCEDLFETISTAWNIGKYFQNLDHLETHLIGVKWRTAGRVSNVRVLINTYAKDFCEILRMRNCVLVIFIDFWEIMQASHALIMSHNFTHTLKWINILLFFIHKNEL